MTDPLKPEELAQLSTKIEQGEALTEEEVTKIVTTLPGTKKTIDGLYSRAKSAEEEKKNFDEERAKLLKQIEETKPKETAPASPDLSITEVLKLRDEGYSDKEILDLTEHAKSLGVPVEKILTNPVFKQGMVAEREKARVDGVIPPSSSPAYTVGNKSWDDIALRGTPEEQSKAFADIMRKNAGGNRSAM
jgi:hypothetical protein